MNPISMRRFYPILLNLVIEAMIYFYTLDITDDPEIIYSLRARYSARLSFIILCTLGTWIASLGLNNIFANAKKRELLMAGIAAFSVNHLIHYYFLFQNFEVSGLDITSKYISFGALAYVILTLAPFLIWKWNSLTPLRYYSINGFIMLMIGICIFTYAGRFSRTLPISTWMWIFKVMIGIGTTILILMVGRMTRERKSLWNEMA